MKVHVEEIVYGHPLWDGRTSGRYTANCDGLHIIARQPFLEMARKLVALDVHPDTELEMWRKGEASWSIRSTVGKAARLTVEEGNKEGPRWRSYKPFSRGDGQPPAAEDEV
jgi:hypothetical protein